MRGWFCCALIFFVAACDQEPVARGQFASWEESIGHLVIDGSSLEAVQFDYREGAEAADGNLSIVSVNDADFDRALRLETLRQPATLDSLEASLTTHRDIEEGSPCWLHLKARAVQPQIETGLARLSIGFQSVELQDHQELDHAIFVEPTWTSVDIPFSVGGLLEAGEARVVLGVGTQLQVIDVGNIVVRCFDPQKPPGVLPKTSFTYVGRASDASWRKIAESRIDRYRRGDIAIKVVDASDEPVPDAEIQLQMTRHAFKFGTVVDTELLAGVGPGGEPSQYSEGDTTRYRKLLQELFNIVTFENGMNWASWSDTNQRRVTEDALSWAKSLDLELRGDRLVSGQWSDLPSDLQKKRDDPDVIRAALRDRISNLVGGLDGQVAEWDVVDRPYDHHELMDVLGWDEVDEWFKRARAAAPEPKLFLNESDVLAGDRLVQLVTMLGTLTERNVPIDAVGIKGHFNEQPPSIQVLSDRLDQLASFELPMMVTEFDMETDDQALRADFMRDLMTLAFSHPSIEGFIFRGFWEGRQTLPEGALYKQDWTIKPTGEIYRNLVLDRWWTDDVALSNVDGDLLTRGFLGDYVITARKNDLSATATLTLGTDGASITLKLDKANSG